MIELCPLSSSTLQLNLSQEQLWLVRALVSDTDSKFYSSLEEGNHWDTWLAKEEKDLGRPSGLG